MRSITILSFSRHPLDDEHLAAIAAGLTDPLGDVVWEPCHLDDSQPFEPQIRALIDDLDIDWQTARLVVHLPDLSAAAACVVADLHGRLGNFPTIVRLRPVPDVIPRRFEVAELIDLNQLRDRKPPIRQEERS